MSDPSINILFVEDSQPDVELSLRALGQDGLRAQWRRVDSETALREGLAAQKPDVIFSDFSMPGFNGLRALEIAREMAPDIPFIFVSGTIGEERAIEAIRSGATDYVLKNNLRRLGTALKRALVEADERNRARKTEDERARLVGIMEATSDYVGMSDPAGLQIYLNAAGRRLVGRPEQDPIGKPIFDIYPAWARKIVEEEARPAAERNGIWQGETAIVSADGKEVPVSQVIIAHRSPDGSSVRFFSTIARDISERKAYEARIQYLANYDALTRLPNRSLLGDRAVQGISHAKRTGRTCALVVVNIDRFKLLNDSYGHAAGDALLKTVAERLSSAVREGDTVARLGADAFAILATDLSRPDDVVHIARKVRDSATAPVSVEGHEVHVKFSVGASSYPKDGENFDLLLRNADAAVNRVKAAGGNGFQFYASAMTNEAVDRIEIENALRSALANREIELHYQPQVELRDGRLVGLEALMRWKHATRGFVSPAQFIPIAEESDLILQLGVWALMDAAKKVAEWRADGQRVRVAVNVSARQFATDGFVDAVARALRVHAIEPACLELELTESALINDRSKAISILEKLKQLGVLVAVDDFGTGYSSLSYLSGLPVDCLKIDRAFVTPVAKGGRDAAIAQAIISLGHTLGLRVLAEGIETKDQLDFLHAHGCDEGQGYYFAKPAAADVAKNLLGKTLPG